MNKPSVYQRLKAAFNFYRYGWRGVASVEAKKWPYSFPTWRTGNPEWQLLDYQTYAQEAFGENGIVYGAIKYWFDSIRVPTLRAYRGSLEEPKLLPMTNELSRLCIRPNRWQAWPEFQGLAQVYLKIAGNSYIYIDRKPGQEIPNALYTLRPDRVFIVPTNNKNEPIGYIYVPEGRGTQDGIPILAKDIIHRKDPNPLDTLEGLGYGLSELSAAARSIDVDNAITKYLKLFFDQGAMPPGLLSFDVPMTPESVAEARRRWMEIYGSVDNWKDIAVLDQDGKYQKLGLTFQEMDMSALDSRNWSEVTTVLGVPLTLIVSRPELVSSTYNNKQSDRVMFWQDRVVPELLAWEREYQYYFSTERSEFVKFDLSKVPALTLSAQEKVAAAQSALNGGAITVNEYRAIIGEDPADDGDVYTIPSSVVVTPYKTKKELLAEKLEEEMKPEPVIPSVQPAPQEETPEPAQTPGNEAMVTSEEEATQAQKSYKIMSMERKTDFWTKSDELAASFDVDYSAAAARSLSNNKRDLLALLNKGKAKAASYDWSKYEAAVKAYLLGMPSAEVWRDYFEQQQKDLMTAKIEQLNAEFNKAYPPVELLSQQWFDEYQIQFAQPINDTTNETIKRMIEQAQNEGWSVKMMQDRLELMFQQWIMGDVPPEEFQWYSDRMPQQRRELIARTETISASNAVAEKLYAAWGTKEKEWLTSRDGRQRETHGAADGQVVKIGEDFTVGGYKASAPGDIRLPASERCQCRCSLLPVI